MMAAPTNPTLPPLAEQTLRGRDDRTARSRLPGEFDALVLAVQSERGVQASVLAGASGRDADAAGDGRSDTHRARLRRMADEAEHERYGGPHSRLAPQASGDEASMGPRGHRLAIQAREQSERIATSPAATSGPAAGTGPGLDDGPTVPPAPPPGADLRRLDDASVSATTGHRVAQGARTATTLSETTNAQRPVARGEFGAPAGAPTAAAVAPQPAGLDAGHGSTSSPAKSIAQFLAVRVEGVLSAKGVSGVDQSGTARTTAQSPAAEPYARRPGQPHAAKERPSEPTRTANQQSVRRAAFDQLVRSLRLNVGHQRSSARLHLRPPELGRIRVDAQMDGERLRVLVQTETPEARALLHSRVAELKSALEQHGIKVDRFDFAPATPVEQNGPLGWTVGAGDLPFRQSAFGQGRHDQTERRERNATDKAGEIGQQAGQDESQPFFGAVAETRLDVRV